MGLGASVHNSVYFQLHPGAFLSNHAGLWREQACFWSLSTTRRRRLFNAHHAVPSLCRPHRRLPVLPPSLGHFSGTRCHALSQILSMTWLEVKFL